MEHIGIDLHKREGQICILTEGGEILEMRIPTDRSRLAAALGDRPKARILIEAATESEWVARCLEGLGHEVVVADPNYAPMYATRSRKVKNDRRDAQALMEACRLGAYRPAHRTSDAQRHVRGLLAVRDALVRTRARYIALIRALLRREGLRVRGSSSKKFLTALGELTLPDTLAAEIAPLLGLMVHLNRQIKETDDTIACTVCSDERVRRLCTVPGVGLVTATTFVATLDQAGRFTRAHQVEAYLGLVPRERSSGETLHRGRITKSGNVRARCLLVEAAWCIMRYKKRETAGLRAWTERIALRRGKSRAAVALARRLAGILYALMRDGTVYHPGAVPRADDRSSVAA